MGVLKPQPIFSRNADYTKIAFVNWRISKGAGISNLLVLGDGFLRSAIEMGRVCLIDNRDKKADIFIFPMLANANHGIELYLKALIWILNKLIGSNSKIEKGHNIKQLYETVRAKVKLYKESMDVRTFNRNTAGLRLYIEELFSKLEATNYNDKMDFPRYPFDTEYENHFYVTALGTVDIDLENFIIRFEAIHEMLDTLSGFLYYDELQQNDEGWFMKITDQETIYFRLYFFSC
jgi:hypothetical protein